MFAKLASFFFMLLLTLSTVFGFSLGDSKTLFNDADFSDGFYVMSQQVSNNAADKKGVFSYEGTNNSPSWTIAQWHSGNCLWDDRVQTDAYTITDGSTKWVQYDPLTKSVTLRLNAANVYKGEAAGNENWPHLLLEQSPLTEYAALSESEKAYYNLDDNRIVLDLKLRMRDFKDTLNADGINAAQFLAYFYLKDTDGNNFIWFGVNLFDNRGICDTYWAKDTVGGNMIYTLSTKDTYGHTAGDLLHNGRPKISDKWTSVRIDLTPHLADCINRANADQIFGETVSLSDFYIGGTNIGFEIHGNYDCTMEIKDFNLTSYK